MCKLCDEKTKQDELELIQYTIREMQEVIQQLMDIRYGLLKPHKDIGQWELLSIQSKNVIKALVEYL